MIATPTAASPNQASLLRLWGVLRVVGWIGAAVILLLPAVAMQLNTPGVEWTAFDFIFAGVLLGGAGLILEIVALLTRKPAWRFGAALVVGLIVAVIWADGAVGIF